MSTWVLITPEDDELAEEFMREMAAEAIHLGFVRAAHILPEHKAVTVHRHTDAADLPTLRELRANGATTHREASS